ncbi:hypothetical protein GHT09_015750 [Marmota monax]|uniref:Uncharacterized protein n=1 Tax=Marmota monax TaxID=9995 RepID=A0A834UJI6_MARMO|nr:hypothetical protein GHT09_015750 [Marmota monax]
MPGGGHKNDPPRSPISSDEQKTPRSSPPVPGGAAAAPSLHAAQGLGTLVGQLCRSVGVQPAVGASGMWWRPVPAFQPACSSLPGLWQKPRGCELAQTVALPDVGPHKPCDETRPQERGFNKRYRFLELRLGDFPEDRLCLAGGWAAGTRLPPASHYLETPLRPGPAPRETQSEAPPGAGPGRTRLAPRVPRNHPLALPRKTPRA